MRLQSIALAAALALASGCFFSRNTTNEPLAADRIAKLVPGQSTASDALAQLGAPNEVVQLGRRSAWRYDHSVMKRAGLALIVIGFLNTDTQADRAWLFFDEKDVLTHVGSTLAASKAEYTMPWNASHESGE
jgi:hypothetical protein